MDQDAAAVISVANAGIASAKKQGFRPVALQLGLASFMKLQLLTAEGRAPDPPRVASLFGLPISMELDLAQADLIRVIVLHPASA